MIVFSKIWNKYNEIQLKKMNLNNYNNKNSSTLPFKKWKKVYVCQHEENCTRGVVLL